MGTTVQRYHTIDALKVLLTVGIVFRHSELLGQLGRSATFDAFDKSMMAVTEICVPLFFVLSGFLYFRNTPSRPDIRFFGRKLRSRFHSLLLPYLIANAVAFGVYWAAYRWAPQWMDGFFGSDWKNPLFVFWAGPVNLSLWFIRDLFIAVLMAPVLWLIVRYTRFLGILAVWIAGRFVPTGPWLNVYFMLGAWLALWKSSWMTTVDGFLIRCRIRPLPSSWQAWCFFIYLYHYLCTMVLKKVLPFWLAPEGFWALLETYLLVAGLTLALLTAFYALLKKMSPALLNILAGGKL